MPHLPQEFLNSLAGSEGFDEHLFVKAHQDDHKITSLRLNPFKNTGLDFETGDPVDWCKEGYYVTNRPNFTHDPLFQAGCYYVQEAGSMFTRLALETTVDFSRKLNILDLCAAPGGKSTLVNSLMNAESLLVANELIKSRAGVLAHNLSKWGTCNAMVTNNDPQRFSSLEGFFDVIVIDAPCSGSGLFRKQPEAIDEWSLANVRACSMRQRDILQQALPALKEDGILLYSTCSYSVEENESVVNWLISEHGLEFVELPVKKEWGIVQNEAGYRFYPHLVKSEGFFCAALRKKERAGSGADFRTKQSSQATGRELELLKPFLSMSDPIVVKKNDQFHMLNSAAHSFLTRFEKQFYFKKAGTVIGEIKGRDLVPNHELALSLHLSPDVKTLDLGAEAALKYLKKESFTVPVKETGLRLMTYKNRGLGWAKLLPNRINNYLPGEHRILK